MAEPRPDCQLATTGRTVRMATRVDLQPCPACGTPTAAVTSDYAADEAGVVIAGPVPVAVLCHNRECDPIHAVTAAKRQLVS